MKTKIPTRTQRAELILNTVRTHIAKEQKRTRKECDIIDDPYVEVDRQSPEDAYFLGWYRAYEDILSIIGPKRKS